ncbi:hypothetical protein M9458_038779, partial [Cirrhinus mrigala]
MLSSAPPLKLNPPPAAAPLNPPLNLPPAPPVALNPPPKPQPLPEPAEALEVWTPEPPAPLYTLPALMALMRPPPPPEEEKGEKHIEDLLE